MTDLFPRTIFRAGLRAGLRIRIRVPCVIMFRVLRLCTSRGRVFKWHNSRIITGENMPARSAWACHTSYNIICAVRVLK